MRSELRGNPFVFAGAIIAGGGEAEEEALDFAPRKPASKGRAEFRDTVTGIGREECRPLAIGEMARVKKVRVDVENFVGHEAVGRVMDETLIGMRELRAKLDHDELRGIWFCCS